MIDMKNRDYPMMKATERDHAIEQSRKGIIKCKNCGEYWYLWVDICYDCERPLHAK